VPGFGPIDTHHHGFEQALRLTEVKSGRCDAKSSLRWPGALEGDSHAVSDA
jgi:hypothetical protein